jgi:hypothetical protein
MSRSFVRVALTATLLGTVVVGSRALGPAHAATATIFTRTFIGTEFQSLEAGMQTQLLEGSGGGAYLRAVEDPAPGQPFYMEHGVDLPVGARVSEVTFYGCGTGTQKPKLYFGSYAPAAGTFSYHVPFSTAATSPSCASGRYTLTKTGNPVTTAVAGRRYVLGALAFYPITSRQSADTLAYALIGARIKYSCPTACT